jgi:PAS domain S-box-containing protein/putative nucleotidyltransferase with HDIG domain
LLLLSGAWVKLKNPPECSTTPVRRNSMTALSTDSGVEMRKPRGSENRTQRKPVVHGRRPHGASSKAVPASPAPNTNNAPLSMRTLDYEGRIADLQAKIHELEESRSMLTSMLRDIESKEGQIERIHHSWVNIFDAIRDPIFMHDKQGRVVRANRAYADAAGMDVKDVIGRLYWEVFPRREGPLDSCCLVLSEKQETAEEDLTLESGLTYRNRLFTLHNPSGRYLASVHIMQDITERKRVETELQWQRDFISTVTDVAGALILVLNKNGRIVRFNHACEKLTGYSQDEAINKPVWEFLLPPEAIEPTRAVFDNLLARKIPVEHENAWVTKDGQRRWIAWSNTVLLDNHGNVEHVIATGIDTTERRAAETALRDNEARFRSLIDNSSDITCIFDPDGTIRYVSPSVERLLGYGIEELVGTYALRLVHPEDLAHARESLDLALRTPGLTHVAEYRVRDKDGTWHYLETLNRSMVDDPAIGGIVLNARDTTERKRVENSLREAESLYRTLYELSPAGITLLDPETGAHIEFNATAHNQLGYSRDEFAKLHISDYVTLEKPEETKEHMEKVLREGKDSFEGKHRTKEGVIRDVFITVQAIERGGRHLLYAVTRDITDIKQANDSLHKLNRALLTLSACNESLIHATDERELLAAICEVIVHTGGYRFAWVGYAEHDAGKTVVPMAYAGEESGFLQATHFGWGDDECGRNPIGEAIRTGEPKGVHNIHDIPSSVLPRDEALHRGYASCLALPLRGGDTVTGVLAIYAAESDAFDEQEIKLLVELADDLVFGIETLHTRAERERAMEENRLNSARMEKALLETIEAIGSALEKRDPYTAGHQRQVAKLAHAIAQEMKLPQKVVEGIYMGCLIHDIGKIYIPAEILSRPGKLSVAEFEIIKCHPQVGYDIVKGIEFPWPVAQMILEHHERLNGSGYPQGLKEDEISIEAKILAVADVVEAMASHRPYRPAVGLDNALEEISENRGTLYDPQAVDVCLRLFREKGFTFV